MNCKLCIQELEAYREGKLPEDIRTQVKTHLGNCNHCRTIYSLEDLTERVIQEEKGIQLNPFLSTRIMTGIEELEQKIGIVMPIPVYQKVLKPALITVSLAVAILVGVMAGNIYKPASTASEVPVELTYMNDAALESVDFLANK
jgi:predicted anti-sigma-YlaC factor YlaD